MSKKTDQVPLKEALDRETEVKKQISIQANKLAGIAWLLEQMMDVDRFGANRSGASNEDCLRTTIELLEERVKMISDLEDDLCEVLEQRRQSEIKLKGAFKDLILRSA
jgi:hypothetical protein